MNTNINGGTVGFFTLNTFNIDNIFGTINTDNFAKLCSFEMSTNNLFFVCTEMGSFFLLDEFLDKNTYLNFIIFSDGHRSNTIFLS